jgi:hypothetical protein
MRTEQTFVEIKYESKHGFTVIFVILLLNRAKIKKIKLFFNVLIN